jgi:hypothetical protein
MFESESLLDNEVYRVVRKRTFLRKRRFFRGPVRSARFDEIPVCALGKLDFQ